MDVKDINLNEYEVSECLDNGNIVLRKKINNYPKWEDLKSIAGAYININSEVCFVSDSEVCEKNVNVFLTEKYAKSALAMAQISQLMPYYGGELTDEEWDDDERYKYIIFRATSRVHTATVCSDYHFLSFHTKEQRDEFLKNNEQLVKDYLMIE